MGLGGRLTAKFEKAWSKGGQSRIVNSKSTGRSDGETLRPQATVGDSRLMEFGNPEGRLANQASDLVGRWGPIVQYLFMKLAARLVLTDQESPLSDSLYLLKRYQMWALKSLGCLQLGGGLTPTLVGLKPAIRQQLERDDLFCREVSRLEGPTEIPLLGLIEQDIGAELEDELTGRELSSLPGADPLGRNPQLECVRNLRRGGRRLSCLLEWLGSQEPALGEQLQELRNIGRGERFRHGSGYLLVNF